MKYPSFTRVQKIVVAGVVLVCGVATGRALVGSDHQDSPNVELNPAMDMTDVYAFPGSASGRIVLRTRWRVACSVGRVYVASGAALPATTTRGRMT